MPQGKQIMERYRHLLATYLKPQWISVAILTFLLFLNIVLQLINPQVVRYFIDTAQAQGEMRLLIQAAMLFLGIAVGQQILSSVMTYLGERIAWTSTNALRADLMLHCLKLDMPFHNTRTPGELIERIDGDVAGLSNFFSQFTIRIMGNLLLLLGVLGVLYYEDWRIGGLFTVYSVLALGALFLARHVAVPYWKTARQSSADLFGFIEEQLSGTEDIRANGATAFSLGKLHHWMRKRLDAELAAALMVIIIRFINAGTYLLGLGLALVTGYYFFNAGIITTIGTVYLLVYYTHILLRPLREITNQMEDFQKAAAGVGRVEELFQTRNAFSDGEGADFPDGPLSVEFEDVSFGYAADKTVLDHVDFTLKPGRILGLIGRTGSGKTTLSRLLFRLYDPAAGQIRLGGVDLREARIQDIRRHIGMVTQDVQLFRASIRDNLTMFNDDITEEKIMDAIDVLGLADWLSAKNQGLDTVLEGDSGVSAGEAQLLSLARVFLKDPGLVILDEASSRLDPATEQQIERAMDALLQDRTGIIIAHRLQTIERADEILVLDNGRVIEYGSREALAGDPASRLYQLLQAGMEIV